jgi:hypothetical protein
MKPIVEFSGMTLGSLTEGNKLQVTFPTRRQEFIGSTKFATKLPEPPGAATCPPKL